MDVQLIEILIIIVRAESSSRKSDDDTLRKQWKPARLSSFMCDDAAVYGRVQAPELWGPQTGVDWVDWDQFRPPGEAMRSLGPKCQFWWCTERWGSFWMLLLLVTPGDCLILFTHTNHSTSVKLLLISLLYTIYIYRLYITNMIYSII